MLYAEGKGVGGRYNLKFWFCLAVNENAFYDELSRAYKVV